jgi:hypothetical protein
VLLEVVQPDRLRVVDQDPEDTAALGKMANEGAR